MKLIQGMEDLSPNEYAQYLDGKKTWASKVLSNPEVVFQNGKNSHEVARQVLDEATEAKFDLYLDYGLYDIHGRLAGYKKR
jgi:hypothetical protein